MIHYDATTNEVEIKYSYQSKGKRHNHTLLREPILLQFHPNDSIGNDVTRVHFEGGVPLWIRQFAGAKGYDLIEMEGAGFSLVKQSQAHLYQMPTIKSTVMEFVFSMPEEYQSYFQPLLDNIHNVIENVNIYQEKLAELGFHFRADEINGDTGAIYISTKLVIPSSSKDDMTEWERIFQQEWQPVVELLVQEVDYDLLEEKISTPTIELPEETEVIAIPTSNAEVQKPVVEVIEIDLPLMDIGTVEQDPEVAIEEVVILGDDSESMNNIAEKSIIIEIEETEKAVEDVQTESITLDIGELENVEKVETIQVLDVKFEAANQEEIKELVAVGSPARPKKKRASKSFVDGQLYLF